MDSRWTFLHRARPELRGRMRIGRAGSEETGARADRNESREAPGARAEKSRYGAARTRTADRHRWMGRGSQGRREKHCQGTRQNGPVTSGEGAPRQNVAAENRLRQLFSKNTGLCETER